jgi:YfiH family protein
MDLFEPHCFPEMIAAGVVGRSAAAREGRGLSFSAGRTTSAADARESREALAGMLGLEPTDLVFARQVHGARVIRVVRGLPPGEADGMVTDEPGIALCLSIADCCAILAADPVHRAVGAFHAGWRGARDGVVEKGIGAMERAFGTEAASLLVYLSPCASVERYEVGPDVACLFPGSVRARGGKLSLDLRHEIATQLQAAGVPPSSIEESPVCTISDQRCHSHRREGASSGRMAAFILARAS